MNKKILYSPVQFDLFASEDITDAAEKNSWSPHPVSSPVLSGFISLFIFLIKVFFHQLATDTAYYSHAEGMPVTTPSDNIMKHDLLPQTSW